MERKINKLLIEWKSSKNRLPMVIQGARQVGKTFSVLDFGKSNFRNVINLNFERNPDLHSIFERDLSPQRIIRELSVWSGETIYKEDSLIFFDEIQACNRALTSLKYFAEEDPSYTVIAAGSLLGVTIKREEYSFPVGKVRTVTLYPLDFEEFLWAMGLKEAVAIIHESFESDTTCSLHNILLDHYRNYLFTGGMPQIVKEFKAIHDLNNPVQSMELVTVLQNDLNDAYIADMAKYAGPHETVRIKAVFNSIPAQLAKENHKFQYKVIKRGARATDYETAIDWLKAAGIVIECQKVTEGRLPLSAFAMPGFFKIYLSDTGLLCSKAGLPFRTLFAGISESYGLKGSLAENYVAAALVAAGHSPFYWESQGKAELDFVIQRNEQIIPIEVKSANNVRSKSLQQFVTRYKPPYSFRISTKNFGFENKIKSIPLYAVFCI